MQILLVLTFLGGPSHASKQNIKTPEYFLGNEFNEPILTRGGKVSS
jgi:hypothetical protein